jgi:hypothetical protein
MTPRSRSCMPATAALQTLLTLLMVASPCSVWGQEQQTSVATPAQSAGPALVSASEEPPEYDALVNAALLERKLGNYAEAYTLFAKAHAVFPSARTLRGMGHNAYDARRYVDAVRHLEAALVSPVRPLDEPLRLEVQGILDAAVNYVGRYRFVTAPADAVLTIDDAEVDVHAQETLLSEGEHKLAAHAVGFVTLRKQLLVRGGEREELTLLLVPVTAETVPTAGRSAARPWYKRAWIWGVVGAAIAGTTTGIVLATRDSHSTERPAYGGTSRQVLEGL